MTPKQTEDLARKAFQAHGSIPDRDLKFKWDSLPRKDREKWSLVVNFFHESMKPPKTTREKVRDIKFKLENYWDSQIVLGEGEYPHEEVSRLMKEEGIEPGSIEAESVRGELYVKWDEWDREYQEEERDSQ